MQLSCKLSDLVHAVNVTAKSVPSQSTLPVLINLKLVAGNGKLVLSGTDLQTFIQTSLDAEVEQEGELCVPSKLFANYVSTLGGEWVTMANGDDRVLHVKDERKNKMSCKGMDASEFPFFAGLNEDWERVTELPGSVLKTMFKKVVFAADKDAVRPAFASVYLHTEGGNLRTVASDSFRLSYSDVVAEGDTKNPNLMIYAADAKKLVSILPDSEIVSVYVRDDGKLVQFKCGDTYFMSRLVEGTYPAYQQVLTDAAYTSSVKVGDLQRALKQANMFASGQYRDVYVTFKPSGAENIDGEIIVEAETADVGNYTGTFHGAVSGVDMTVRFNCTYLLDILNVFSGDETVVIGTTNPLKPVFITPVNELNKHMVMPLTAKA